MSDTGEEGPEWLPDVDEAIGPRPDQEAIISSEDYPMRVLAGAGTGKTFTMVRKIEHLIANEDVAPDDILALTFTNKAADSMRMKLNGKLGAAGYDVDAFTYHSICKDLLTEYAYYADVDPGFELADDGEKLALILDILDEIPYRFIKPDVHLSSTWGSGVVETLQDFIGSMKRSGITPDELQTYLGDPHRLTELGEIPNRVEELADEHVRVGWRKITEERLAEMCDGLTELQAAIAAEREHLDADRAAVEHTVDTALSQMEAVCTQLIDAFREHEATIVEGDLDSAFKLPGVLFGTYGSPPSGIPDEFDLDLTAVLGDYLETCQTACDLTAGYAAYEGRMAEAGYLDFDDLVVETTTLLENEDLRETIATQWEYVFCDEFQDTDRLQFDLVEHLTTDENLFVVGDDDQAIYEWRGANVDNIRGELDETFGPGLVDQPLAENFRSRQPILDLANNALELIEDRASEKELDRIDEPDYDGATVATIEAPDDDEDMAAQQVVNTVSHLVAGESEALDETYTPGDIAILVRKNRHAQPIIDAFEAVGIPYELAGDLTSQSVGVETVLAYLKALARPERDEVSWNRVLTMRYRLHDADLRFCNTQEEPLITVLREYPLEHFREPPRIEEAREDIDALLDMRDSVSVARLYRELKDRTDIEWYLSDQERRDLETLEEFITAFGDGPVQPELDEQFLEAIEYHGSLTQESGAGAIDQPEVAADAVNIMTIHKSKGLDFPVVILPELIADEWAPRERSFTALNHALTRDATAPVRTDLERRDVHESRRLFHVGVTRAEDVLVLQGRSDTDDEGAENDDVPIEFVDDVLGDTVPWRAGGVSFPIWQDIQESLESHTDWTDTLAAEGPAAHTADIRYDASRLDKPTARDRVLSLARAMLDESLDSPAASPLVVDGVDETPDIQASLRHSYTSLESFETCHRRHYLDYVTRAFDDYDPSPVGSAGPSQRQIGLLFHETAEVAATRGLDTQTEWMDLCEELAPKHDWTAAIGEAKECIVDYFDSPVSDWTIVSAEREFAIDIGGETVTGFIDAIYRTQAGDIRIIDYKATEQDRSLNEKQQLPLYLLACRDLLDEPVDTAGYLFVGPRGPDLELRTFSDEELAAVEDALTAQFSAIDNATFEDYTAGDHCEFCPHRSLPCSDEMGD